MGAGWVQQVNEFVPIVPRHEWKCWKCPQLYRFFIVQYDRNQKSREEETSSVLGPAPRIFGSPSPYGADKLCVVEGIDPVAVHKGRGT